MCVREEREGGAGGGGGRGGGGADTELKTKTPHVNVGKNIISMVYRSELKITIINISTVVPKKICQKIGGSGAP